MALNINEQIAALEEQLNLIKGPGSVAKKKAVQAEIDELKASVDKPEEEVVVDEDEEVVVRTPMPTKWVKVTLEQVKQAEKDFKLCGFDPDKMIALIKP